MDEELDRRIIALEKANQEMAEEIALLIRLIKIWMKQTTPINP